MAGKEISTTRFGSRDRRGALMYASRMAREFSVIYVLFYDYTRDEWTCEIYWEFNARHTTVCYEDVRYVLPHGEVTRLS